MDRDFNQLKIGGPFLNAFKELQAFQANGTPTSPSNVLVQMFGSPSSAITNLGASTVQLGNIGTAANTVDRNFNNKYAAAGLPQTFLRNYPQFNQVILGTNSGRSYYDALQVSVRRSTGALRLSANYTYAKNIDNISVDGNGFTTPVDNLNIDTNRAVSDFDHRQSFNGSMVYTLPFGQGQRFGSGMPKWLDTIAGGWEIGNLFILQDGVPFSVFSQRASAALTTTTLGTFANFTGDRSIGGVTYGPGGSVFFFTPAQVAQFTFPNAGEIGSSGRNAFRGPRYFDIDSSLVKHFKITEHQAITFRAEAYNVLNNPNFSLSNSGNNNNVNLNNAAASFGKLSATQGTQGLGTSARNMQLTLRYDF